MTFARRYRLLLVSILLMLLGLTTRGTMAAPVEAQGTWLTASTPPHTQAINYSGEIYFDMNLNGIREYSEDGIEGVTVTLETLHGEIIQETESGIDGEYLFTELPEEGTFRVRIRPLPGFQTTSNGDFTISTNDPQGMISRSTGLFRGLFLPIIHRS